MLKDHSQLQLSLSPQQGLYDAIIPADHLLRRIKENIDFSFVNPMLRKMLKDHSQLQLSLSPQQGLYDAIIPADHLLRRIKENIDFSFVNPMLRKVSALIKMLGCCSVLPESFPRVQKKERQKMGILI